MHIQLSEDVLDQDVKLNSVMVRNKSKFGTENMLKKKIVFIDYVGDQFTATNRLDEQDNDPMDNCSDSSHGILFRHSILVSIVYIQVHMLLE